MAERRRRGLNCLRIRKMALQPNMVKKVESKEKVYINGGQVTGTKIK